ncbi:copper homeostasis protein CutC [Psychromonas sp. psych-6C06]|uniref:copper homeostasis protein CutC n=1 Tax=Psychromonas sp. psych-6C06 TaxID=2058089 RepID=UPI000C324AA1|nr:copper homeostasis protein CutC [Psychromonas sp. psych-6C06]PKF63730.1 copper homeostasis protein CutC [Psychromonas sp. psych-6C06]
MINLEVCIDNIESLFTAQQAGADRIELCGALALGGLSPSSGLITQVMKHASVPVNVMVRPRDGDFLYSSHEVEMMLHEIHTAKKYGMHGVVFGALDKQAKIDVDILKSLMRAAEGLSVTFHRAIDCCEDAHLAIDTLLSVGCDRVLTSGLASNAELGADCLKSMVSQSQGRLIIMAGAGINANNVAGIIKDTGVSEVHLSGKVSRASQMENILNCGYLPEFMKISVTSADKISTVKQAIQGF